MKIADYALLGSRGAAGLVATNGSIDWLCVPRFDSSACFAALLGSPENGRWLIAPEDQRASVHRHYRKGTTVLETTFETAKGTVTLTDAMCRRDNLHDVLRRLQCTSGRVKMRLEFIIRFDYGLIKPRLENVSRHGFVALSGPDRFIFHSDAPVDIDESTCVTAAFEIEPGKDISFSLTWSPARQKAAPPGDVGKAIEQTSKFWTDWSGRFKGNGRWAEAELQSLVAIQALTDQETGGFVAAATTSLPEEPGGEKNWDYRFCWLRDGAFSIRALVNAGFTEEANAWTRWLLRAAAGSPDKMQIMYGAAGERNLKERILKWLPGYQNSRPVRDGNEASSQFQLDVYGQVVDVFYEARAGGLDCSKESWEFEKAVLADLQNKWRYPGAGIWEMRNDRVQFTESKVLCWAAFDRGIRSVEQFGLDGPVDDWRRIRKEIHDEVCCAGFNSSINSFVQYYGSDTLDGSLLILPLFGFLPADDPRMRGTVAAIEKRLLRDGLVVRYETYGDAAKSPAKEGTFLPCSFWLVDNYVLQNRLQEASDLLEHLLSLRNDVGLLSEEYDTREKQLIGNIPQALTHAALITSVQNLNDALKKGKGGDQAEQFT